MVTKSTEDRRKNSGEPVQRLEGDCLTEKLSKRSERKKKSRGIRSAGSAKP